MAGYSSGHDLDVSVFSPEGKVFQVDYACKAVDNAGTAIGICCTDGVVVAVEKILSSRMLEGTSDNRCHAVDKQAGICIAGVLPDGRALVQRARGEAAQVRDAYAVPILGRNLATRLGEFMHLYTCDGYFRPFGATAILASYADDGPQLYVADPSGNVAGFNACSAGKQKTAAKTELETIDFSTVTCAEAVKKAAEVLYKVHQSDKDKLYELEISWVCDASGRTFQHVPKDMVPPKPQ